MKISIFASSACPIRSLEKYRTPDYVLMRSHQDFELNKLVREFGFHSKNHGLGHFGKDRMPVKSFTEGSGLYPVSTHVIPYLVDEHDLFTIVHARARIGGIFVPIAILDTVMSYLDTIPYCVIEDHREASRIKPRETYRASFFSGDRIAIETLDGQHKYGRVVRLRDDQYELEQCHSKGRFQYSVILDDNSHDTYVSESRLTSA